MRAISLAACARAPFHVVLLDRQGVVRDIHIGYSATLRDNLGEKIRELLAEK